MVEPSQYAAFLQTLAGATRAVIESPPESATWLPAEHCVNMLDAAHRVALAGDAERVAALSEASMNFEIRRLASSAMRLSTPQFAITRAIKLWDICTRHSGRVELEVLSPQSCDLHFVAVPLAHSEAFLPFVRGAMRALLRLCTLHTFVVQAQPTTRWERQTLHTEWSS
jgi:hypothetical protein